MKEQVEGKKVCKLVTKRKKAPHKALHIWKYNMMRQKENMFSSPLVHGKEFMISFFLMDSTIVFLFLRSSLKCRSFTGMCVDLANTYKVEFPRGQRDAQEKEQDAQRQRDAIDLNVLPQEEQDAQGKEQDARGKEQDARGKEQDAQ
jgi:hypothetical protein